MKPTKKQTSSKMSTAVVSVPRSIAAIVPNVLTTKLRYSSYVDLDPTAGQFKTHILCPSSLYDPDYTGVGHQPMGFDQLAALFAHYYVNSCKITVKAWPTSVGVNPAVWGIYLTHDNGSSGPWTNMLEQDPTRVRSSTIAGAAANPMAPQTLSMTYNARKVSGVTDLGDSGLSSVVTASPADNFFFVIWYQAMDLSADLSSCKFEYLMEFDATLFVKKEAPAS